MERLGVLELYVCSCQTDLFAESGHLINTGDLSAETNAVVS